MRVSSTTTGDLGKIPHPLANHLPSLNGANGCIATRVRPGARLAYLDDALIGPILWDEEDGDRRQLTDHDALLRYLGRTVSNDDPEDGLGQRFVEPGVGRSCLLDFLALSGLPEFMDFTASGIGLTQYSVGGYVAVGRTVDGQVALKRAHHRRRNAERLEAAGCRASRVVAIIELPNQWVTMLDGSQSPAVVMVRAFRSVLRVKQLDPVAGFYHGEQHAARIAALLMEKIAEEGSRTYGPQTMMSVAGASAAAAELECYAASYDDFHRVLGLKHPLPGSSETRPALRIRQAILAAYAPILFALARQRAASTEPTQDSGQTTMSTESYVDWFADTLGAQLARMHQIRFLHDYHHPGVSRYRPDWLYSLVELNVTLCGEFADLETGVFVDSSEEEVAEALQLSPEDLQILRANFETFHETDVEMARRVVRSLSTAAVISGGAPGAAVDLANARFEESYRRLLRGS
jgi:hypothetical protein